MVLMAEMKEPRHVLRVCSCLTSHQILVDEVASSLSSQFGEIALVSEPFNFDLSTYYEPEMGTEIMRYWFCFSQLFGADKLAEYRLHTGKIEDSFAVEGNRIVNLDPGYLDFGKLVLASLKEGADKIYLGQCVWAHTCLRFRNGKFTAPDHSFADFKAHTFDDFFIQARGLYKQLLKC